MRASVSACVCVCVCVCVCQKFMQRAEGAEPRLHFDIFLSSFVSHILYVPGLK